MEKFEIADDEEIMEDINISFRRLIFDLKYRPFTLKLYNMCHIYYNQRIRDDPDFFKNYPEQQIRTTYSELMGMGASRYYVRKVINLFTYHKLCGSKYVWEKNRGKSVFLVPYKILQILSPIIKDYNERKKNVETII